jgi:MFS family permease
MMIMLSDVVDSAVRGTAVGLYRTFMDLGGIFGPIVFMFCYEAFGTRAPFFIGGAMILANIGLVVSVRIPKPKPIQTSS